MFVYRFYEAQITCTKPTNVDVFIFQGSIIRTSGSEKQTPWTTGYSYGLLVSVCPTCVRVYNYGFRVFLYILSIRVSARPLLHDCQRTSDLSQECL